MLKDKSLLKDSDLFEELDNEKAALIEGGAYLHLFWLESLLTGADSASDDDPYINVNGTRLWGEGDFSGRQSVYINRGIGFTGSATVALYDADWPDDDDLIGRFTVSETETTSFNQFRMKRLSGAGSVYNLYYKVYA